MHLNQPPSFNFKRVRHLRTFRFVCTVFCCLVAVMQGEAQIKTVSGKVIKFAEMDSFLREQMDSLKLPALSIAFINDGKIVYQRCLGVANLETGKKADDQSIFEAASLSKPVFALLVLKMAESGKIDLDKRLHEYLPFPEIAHDERYKLITARMVLSHTTGFPNWRWYDKPDPKLNIKEGDMYMMHAPGRFSYSGEGYHWLGKVVAKIYGITLKSLDSLFQREVARPLGVQQAYFSWHPYVGAHKVTGYKDGKEFMKAWPAAPPDEDSTIFGAASTLHTNAANYARFLIAIIEGKMLRKTTFDGMLSMQSKIPTEMEPYWGFIKGWGLGFAVEPTSLGTRYSHGGDNGGFQASCLFYRDKKMGHVYFTNCDRLGMFYMKLMAFIDEMPPTDTPGR